MLRGSKPTVLLPKMLLGLMLLGLMLLGLMLLAMMLAGLAGCGRAQVKPRSACDNLLYTEEGLSREVYLPCAGEILDAMDALRPEIAASLDGDKEARKRAKKAYRALRTLVRKAGGTNLLQGWSDSLLGDLNVSIYNAYTGYWAATVAPNRTDFENAARSHDEARMLYEGL